MFFSVYEINEVYFSRAVAKKLRRHSDTLHVTRKRFPIPDVILIK